MRNFEGLEVGSFKAFWAAAETLNFTLAAKMAGLTQSGVSQHVGRLENQLGVSLFKRVGKRVFLTDSGMHLKSYIEKYLDDVERFKEAVSAQNIALEGDVTYAMPASCLMSPHFGILLEERKKKFPGVNLAVTLCPSEAVVQKILNNEIHFGFVTQSVNHPAIKLIPFCKESYRLVASRILKVQSLTPRSIFDLQFISYPGVDILFEHWRQFHFPKAAGLNWQAISICGQINSLSGAIQMVQSGMGVSLFPEHCIETQLNSRVLIEPKISSQGICTNQIYICVLKETRLPKRVEAVIEVFRTMSSK